jgi:hypothetical protein
LTRRSNRWIGQSRESLAVVLSFRSLGVAFVALLVAVLALHFAALAHYPKEQLDPYRLSDFYPLSVFVFRAPKLYQLGVTLALGGCFAWAWPRLSRARVKLGWLVLAGLAFAVLSNLQHGVRFGLDFPTATSGGSGIEYYHDAIVIPGPLWLVRHYNAIQFELLEHARTHPPGPVLLYWLLWRALVHPVAISIAIAALGLGLTLPYLRRLLVLTLGEEPPGALALFTVLPGTLIYGLATVDGPIAGLFLGTLVCFLDDRRRLSWLWASLFLFASLFFSFGALFLLPVLFGFELVRRRSLKRSVAVLAVAAALLVLVKLGLGFDWWRAFWKAAVMENAKGFLLIAEPKRYLWYRLGAVAEISLFFTPFVALLWWRGRSALKAASADGFALAWLGPLSLACMLLAGALKIGEAARVCLFIVPYLCLPAFAAWQKLEQTGQARVAHAVLAFGCAMQLFGFYQW